MINKIMSSIHEHRDAIIEISHQIHAKPELGFAEHLASNYICEFLEKIDFKVQRGVGHFETAFIAKRGHKTEHGKRVAILAEYDALPGIGHGCGHNIISAVACGVAMGFAELSEDKNFDGELLIIGTPAEETGGGKIELLNLGVFDHVDCAMMVHPASSNMVGRGGTALVELNVTYKGERAHSSAPEKGINALKALIQTFNGIDALQNEFPIGIHVNGIITEGGEASNIIPDRASAEFIIRGFHLRDLKPVKDKIVKVIKAAELLTGAKASYTFKLPYAERYPNPVLAEAFKAILESLGERVQYPEKNIKLGSSDIGNISLVLPIIHPYVKIGDNLKAHTVSFTEAACSHEADVMIIKASKALAQLTYKFFTDERLQEKTMGAFTAQVPDYKDFIF